MTRWPGDARAEQTSFGGLTRSALMSRVRSKGNKTTELRLRRLLRSESLSGWRRHAAISGTPDFVWPRERVAVFVHGCFWHGHDCGRWTVPATNAVVWEQKIRRNRAQDRRATRELRERGWSVLTIWECRLSAAGDACVSRIRRALARMSRRPALYDRSTERYSDLA